jgi:hypothetical protein
MPKVTKEKIVRDFKEIAKFYFQEFTDDRFVTRDYWRSHKSEEYSEQEVNSFFGKFKHLAKLFPNPNPTKRHRDDFTEVFENKKFPQTFVFSAVVSGAKVFDPFVTSIETFCKANNAKFSPIMMQGIHKNDMLEADMWERFNIITECRVNNNLVVRDFKLKPTTSNPLAKLLRFGGGDHSLIVASPKQHLETVSAGIGKHPHIVMSTGTISLPEYTDTTDGVIGKQDNLLGAIIVYAVSKELFFWRHIQADEWGGFCNEGKYYCGKKITRVKAEALIFEPHWGVEDPDAIFAIKEQIREYNPTYVIMHDCLDNSSVNPHEIDDVVRRSNKQEHQKYLLKELEYVGKRLEELCKEFPHQTFYIVPSNHDDFIDRILRKANFSPAIVNPDDAGLCGELLSYLHKGLNPKEVYLKKNFKIPNVVFGKLSDSFKIGKCEVNKHFHKGMSGTRGSSKGMEKDIPIAFGGHSHSPLIYRGIYVIGFQGQLQQPYTEGHGSKWAHCSGLIYPNGNRQLLISIGKRWR